MEKKKRVVIRRMCDNNNCVIANDRERKGNDRDSSYYCDIGQKMRSFCYLYYKKELSISANMVVV